MSAIQQLTPVIKLLGISSCSFLTAYITSFSLVTIPALQAAPISATNLAKQWTKAFELGMATAPAFAIASSSCFAFLAYQSRGIKGTLPFPPSVLYTAAALVAPCIVPYTRLVMWRGIKAICARANGDANAPSEAETKALIERWSAQNMWRAYITGVATVLGTVAMLM